MPQPVDTSTHDSVRLPDGSQRYLHAWPQGGITPTRAAVLVVHGLGEHGARYAELAARLNGWGFDVFAYDHLGHGRSPGRRGVVPAGDGLVGDLEKLVDAIRGRLPQTTPLVLLGHSMGGLLAAQLVATSGSPVDALVLSSPALATRMTPLQRALARLGARCFPDLVIGNGLDASRISHDANQVAAYRDDVLMHDRISARLADAIDRGGAEVLQAAPAWSLPTLLLYAGDGALVDPQGSRRFAASASALVEAREFDGLYHELFNEAGALSAPVFTCLRDWLQARFP